MKRSVILTDRVGPDILLVLRIKRQVLHRERAHLKVPGCSLVFSVLLTKKLPTFLSRLNEISGGCEKFLPVRPPNNYRAASVGRFDNYVIAFTKIFKRCPLFPGKFGKFSVTMEFKFVNFVTAFFGEKI